MKLKNNVLDLHGTKIKDVFAKVDKFIGGHIIKGTPEVEIITGKSRIMKTAVDRVLDDYELYSQKSILNSGKLIINLM
jgi:DNA-nicking Smr family endonuclease